MPPCNDELFVFKSWGPKGRWCGNSLAFSCGLKIQERAATCCVWCWTGVRKLTFNLDKHRLESCCSGLISRFHDDFNSVNSYFLSLVGIGEKMGRASRPATDTTPALSVHLSNNTEGGQGRGQASSSTAERRWCRELTGDKWINRWSPLNSSLRMTEQKAKHTAWVNDRVRGRFRRDFSGGFFFPPEAPPSLSS